MQPGQPFYCLYCYSLFFLYYFADLLGLIDIGGC
jgi:hypothetical protein